MTYRHHTDKVQTTHRQHKTIFRQNTDNIQITYRYHKYNIQNTDNIQTTYRQLTDNWQTTYRQHTDNIKTTDRKTYLAFRCTKNPILITISSHKIQGEPRDDLGTNPLNNLNFFRICWTLKSTEEWTMSSLIKSGLSGLLNI